MALFKFRKGRDEQPAPSKKKKPAPTVEAVRRRAMHRLIGAAVLVLAGVIGFPLIFDNQPRPISVDLPIQIVDKNRVKPLVLPPAPPAVDSAAAQASRDTAPEPAPAPVAAATPPVAAPAVVEPAPAPTPAPAAAKTAEPEIRALDAKKARALLEGRVTAAPAPAATPGTKPAAADAAKTPPKAASNARYVVQVGAFADASKVREVRRKVEAAGLKTYTQVVGTSEGDRTRVRVGPFSDRADADKAAETVRKLKLAAAILTL